MSEYYDVVYKYLFDYKTECDLYESILKLHQKPVRRVLDIACGTGNHSFILAKRGFQVTGIDKSNDMITIALKKLEKNKSHQPRFFHMDMKTIKLKDKYDAAIIPGAGFCYLLKDSDVEKIFSGIKKNLVKNGILAYEFWQTPHDPVSSFTGGSWNKIPDVDKKQIIIKLNSSKYDKIKKFLTKTYEFYILSQKSKQVLKHFKESHVTRTHSIPEMKKKLINNGFTSVNFYVEDFINKKITPAKSTDFRILCVAKIK